MVRTASREKPADLPIQEWLKEDPSIDRALVCSVRKGDGGLRRTLERAGVQVWILDHHTPLPIQNKYRSPQSLGKDRLAAAVGASARFPGQNLLIIDAGTALTVDLVTSKQEYLGGNISPGLNMRFEALHRFTDNLPRLAPEESTGTAEVKITGQSPDQHGPGDLLGDDTAGAITAGVQNGIIFEVDEYINRLKIRYPDLQVIITGGDAMFFDKRLKSTIFVDSDLNLHGLDRILDYNAGI